MSAAAEPCGNEDCDRCYPLPRWVVSTHRVQHLTHTRKIKAATREEALAIYAQGTAWPSSYDDRDGEIIRLDPTVIEQVTDERELRFHHEHHCYHDLAQQQFEEAGHE